MRFSLVTLLTDFFPGLLSHPLAHPNNLFAIATLLSLVVEQCRASLPCCVGSGWRHPAASGNGGVGSRCGTWLQGVAPPTWHFRGEGEVAQEGVSLEKLIL